MKRGILGQRVRRNWPEEGAQKGNDGWFPALLTNFNERTGATLIVRPPVMCRPRPHRLII